MQNFFFNNSETITNSLKVLLQISPPNISSALYSNPTKPHPKIALWTHVDKLGTSNFAYELRMWKSGFRLLTYYTDDPHLGLLKIQRPICKEGHFASLCQISWLSVDPLPRYSDLSTFLQNGSRPPSWIHLMHTGTTHEEYLVVLIVVQNLIRIYTIVSIIWWL